jgi:hypothetical protein
MDVGDQFQIIAEISIAFAGFSGLIVALRIKAGPLTPVQKFRLQVLLGLSFGALFLSFLPAVLSAFGADGSKVWQICIAVIVAYSLVFNAWWVLASRRAARAAPEIFNWFAFSRMMAGHLLVMGIQCATLFPYWSALAPAAFLLGLVWYLLHATQQFCRMLFVQVARES